MGTVGWLLVVTIGIALGISIGRLWPGAGARLNELERERDAARENLRRYRQDVSAHFERTAELFDKVTADYRGLYEHLASGSRKLSAIPGESTELPLAEPERRRLGQLEPAAPEHVGARAAPEAANDDEPQSRDDAGGPDEPPADGPGAAGRRAAS
jgi:uncharacterized protein